jgi:Na+-driven multidrug efflux pump
MRPRADILRGIYAVGVPSMVTIGLGSAMSYCMNQIVLAFSTTATAVFGIWLKMQSFAFMPVFGMNNGTIAIYSYNYGAKKMDRVRATMRLALMVGIGVTTAVTLLYEVVPVAMMKMFNASEYMFSIGIPAMRICALSLPFGACSIILSSAFQSLGHARYTLMINICRQLVIQVVAGYLLSLSGVLGMVWFAPLIAEAGAMVIALFLRRRVLLRLGA